MRRYILIQFALCLAFVGVLQAASPELTEKILTDGWSRKYSARKKLDALMASPGATQLKNQQAHLLALIHQRRYREALPIATRMSSATSAAQKEIWVSVVMRKYSAALASMQRMAGKVTRAPKKDQIKQAQFLGRMMGFLDGPVRKKTKQADRDRVRHEIEKNLGPLQTQFNQAHASVMKQYMGKVNELAKVITLGIEQEKKLRAQLKVDLEEIRKKNKDDQSRLDDKVEKTERQFRREESSLRKQDLPLQRELDRVDDAAVGLQIDRSRTVRRIWRELDWERERDRRRNRDGRRRFRRFNSRLEWLRSDLDRHDYELSLLQRRANRAQWQRVRLANQANQLRRQYGNAARTVRKEQKKLNRRRSRVEYQARKLNKPIRGHSARSNDLRRRLTLLASYVTLPLEQERAALFLRTMAFQGRAQP